MFRGNVPDIHNATIIDVITSGLANNVVLTAVENKIPNINSSVKKVGYDAKISEIEKKLTDHILDEYITSLSLI